MFERFTPRFVKKYADLSTHISHAFEACVREVQAESFPTKDHAFHIKAEELTQAMAAHPRKKMAHKHEPGSRLH